MIKNYSYWILKNLELSMKKRFSNCVKLHKDNSSDANNRFYPSAENGWDIYDFKEEFHRQGVNKDEVKFWTLRCWGR